MDKREEIIDYIDNRDHIDEFCDFLSDLIQQESYDGMEENVAQVIRAHFKREKIYVEEKEALKRPNLVAFYYDSEENFNKSEDKILVYNGHMDTVPPGDWKNAFSGKRDNKFIYGRGSTDMKAGLAAIILSLTILKKLDVKLKGNLIINAVSDEERTGSGTIKAIQIMRSGKKLKIEKSDFVVVAEPTSFINEAKSIVIGEKGSINYRIKTLGERGHSGLPFEGKNPIYKMAQLIREDFLKTIVDKIDEKRKEKAIPLKKQELIDNLQKYTLTSEEEKYMESYSEFIPRLTCTCTIFKAGSVPNVIPGDCEATINFRFLPAYDVDVIYKTLKLQMEQEAKKLNIKPLPIVNPSVGASASVFENYKDSEDLTMFSEIVGEVYGIEPFNLFFPATTDARLYRTEIDPPFCPQTIVFGPGYLKDAHQIDEKVNIQDFINAIKIYTLFAYDFLNGE
jgi:acetylornithine deacetylase/succinyl-diaminopimelate desuccinylase-like protein